MTTVTNEATGMQYEDGRSPSPMTEALIQMFDGLPKNDLAAYAEGAIMALTRQDFHGAEADVSALPAIFTIESEGTRLTGAISVEGIDHGCASSVDATWHAEHGTQVWLGSEPHTVDQAGQYASAIVRLIAAVAA